MCAASTIFLTRDYERSAALAEEALGLFGQLGDKKRVADMLDRLAAPVAHLGDYARAKASPSSARWVTGLVRSTRCRRWRCTSGSEATGNRAYT
jgi:hypothetical protein